MTSIYDVAAASGVSITTVSHVYSGNRHVAPETVARVLETARKLNYSPRLSAKARATAAREAAMEALGRVGVPDTSLLADLSAYVTARSG